MTKLNWTKATQDRLLAVQGSQMHEDFLPRGPAGHRDKPVAAKTHTNKKKKKRKPRLPPKIGADGLTKAERRKQNAQAKADQETKAKNGFAAAIADPGSVINIAAEKTRKRWAQAKIRDQKRRRK